MPIIIVTATLRFEYDPDEGVVTTEADAVEDMKSVLDSDPLMAESFEITVTTEGIVTP